MVVRLFILSILILIISCIQESASIDCAATPIHTEDRLRKNLLCIYDKDSRPVKDSNKAIVAFVALIVLDYSYDHDTHRFSISSNIRMNWTDEFLVWDKKEYDKIDKIIIHADEIWLPEITIYNSASTQFYETCSTVNCMVLSNGTVMCNMPCSHEGFCEADYRYWPFDKQKCEMNFGSWAHDREAIDFIPSRIVAEDLNNNEWKLSKYGNSKIVSIYQAYPNDTFVHLNYWFLIERHFAFDTAVFVFPVLIFSAINIITTLLDPGQFERTLLIAVSFLGHIKYMMNTAWKAPKNGDVAPYLIIFYSDSLLITTYLFLNTILMRALLKCNSPAPKWFKSAVSALQDNRIGQFVFAKDYLIRRDGATETSSDGQVEEQAAGKDDTEKVEQAVWRTIVKVFDRILLIALIVVYIVIICSLIPRTYHGFMTD